MGGDEPSVPEKRRRPARRADGGGGSSVDYGGGVAKARAADRSSSLARRLPRRLSPHEHTRAAKRAPTLPFSAPE